MQAIAFGRRTLSFHLMAQDRLLDGQKLQEIADALSEVNYSYSEFTAADDKRLSRRRRQVIQWNSNLPVIL
jgi:hypothetical protein